MKKIAVIGVILISAVMLLSACGTQQNGNDTVVNNEIQKPDSSEISSQNPPAKPTEKTNTVENNPQPSTAQPTEISAQELKKFLNTNKSEILKVVGSQTESGTISIMESHMVFPFIFVRDLGLTFVFPNEIDDFSPTYIVVDEETNVKNVNLKGAKPGMSFKDIISKAGDGQIQKTWFSNEDDVAYRLDFKADGMIYSFVSYDETGADSQLYILEDSE